MAFAKCPGQDQRFWKPEDIFEAPCPHCGRTLEFWKDDLWRKCRHCGRRAPNPKVDLGCAEWCRHAEQCLGSVLGMDADAPKRTALVAEMKKVFDGDARRIGHALEVLGYAEEILEAEGGDALVVKAAAVLHDIGIPAAERKHGSAAAKWQEQEGPPVAREILERLGIDAKAVEHVVRIVGCHHSGRGIDTPEFHIVWDADRLANWDEECAGKTADEVEEHIATRLHTPRGRALARQRAEEGGARGEE